tara:strand:- start:7467 stop:9611 length:2145 start_codon:yes stop_codon:yes gene_type:complete
MADVETEAASKTLVLLPHQQALRERALSGQMKFPLYLLWKMGSGKTMGSLACTYAVQTPRPAKVLVVCPLSLVGQWNAQIKRFFGEMDAPPRASVRVAHYEELQRGVVPKAFDMVIVDEAARFRNAFKQDGQPEVLRYEIDQILKSDRIVYLSGTPILSDPLCERQAFDRMMKVAPGHPADGRVSVYDPQKDRQFMRRFARRRDHWIEVPMLWSQTLLYFMFWRQRFKIDLPPRHRLFTNHETGNSFESQLIKIANNPFCRPKFDDDDPEASPKIMRLVENVEALLAAGRKQIVFSNRKGEGVEHVRFLLVARDLSRSAGVRVPWAAIRDTKRATSPLPARLAREARRLLNEKFLILSGDVDGDERFTTISEFNRSTGKYRRARVLVFTKAAGFGVDLSEVGDVHLLEVNAVSGEEDQVVSRALRLYGHRKGNKEMVGVHHYVSVFPGLAQDVDDTWDDMVASMNGCPDEISPAFSERVRQAFHEQHVSKTAQTIDEKHRSEAERRRALVDRENGILVQFDPNPNAGTEQSWSARARELVRRNREAQAADECETTRRQEPSGFGWKNASRNAKAVQYMRAAWWPLYSHENRPGMYDAAWREAMAAYGAKLPPPDHEDADKFRKLVIEMLKKLRTDGTDVLSQMSFIKQVLPECKHTQRTAFKRALLRLGYIVAANNGTWRWRDSKRTFKDIPLPQQNGHAELRDAFEAECSRER